MHKVITRAGWLLFVILLCFSLLAQESGRVPIPEKIIQSLDGLQKTRTANGIFRIQYQNAYFWALEKAVYVNMLFSADLDSDAAAMKEMMKKQYDEKVAAEMKKLEEINKKIKKEEDKKKWEPPALEYPTVFHDLYMRVSKDNRIIQEYRSHIPYDGEAAAYYSFGTILAPGEYDVLLAIDRSDHTQDGTQIFTLSVPALTVLDIIQPKDKLEISTPVFYRDVKQLPQSEERFTVVKNKFSIGPARLDFFPFPASQNQFKSSESPILTFFIRGAVMVQSAEPWKMSAKLEVRQGKDVICKFSELKLANPYFDQPLVFARKVKDVDAPLAPGEYELHVELVDLNSAKQKSKGEFSIPFRITE
jgi:hypothetical protein